MKQTELKTLEDDKPTSLSKDKARRFEELTGIIEKGMKTCFEVGSALAEIRDQKLHRAKYPTWDAYLMATFGMERSYATRQIKAAEVVIELERMLPIGNILRLPINEAQVRPLHKLQTPDQRALAWKAAVEASPDTPPTAMEVTKSVNSLLSEGSPSALTPDAEQDTASDTQADCESDINLDANSGPITEEAHGDDELTTSTEPADENEGANGEVSDPKRVDAVLVDGSKCPCALWSTGYLDAEVMQLKLDEIGRWSELIPERRQALQKLLIGITGHMNQVVDDDPTNEMRNGIFHLVREVLHNLPIVGLKPGDSISDIEEQAAS